MRGLGLLVLLFAIGIVFVAHGLPKLVPVWETGPAQASALLEAAGVSSAYPVTVGSGIVEVVAGSLLRIGRSGGSKDGETVGTRHGFRCCSPRRRP